MRVAPPIVLTDKEQTELTPVVAFAAYQRTLGAARQDCSAGAQGLPHKEIAAQLGIGQVQVARWRERYRQAGTAGIERDLLRAIPHSLPRCHGRWPHDDHLNQMGQCVDYDVAFSPLDFLAAIDPPRFAGVDRSHPVDTLT